MEQGVGEGSGGDMNRQPHQESRGGHAQVQAPQQSQKCPRCDSLNTKFCYYNNYSLSQPRYFCKTCRRYWTQGGTLRNVPVGGGCRKGKRAKTSNPSSSENISSSRSLPQQQQQPPPPPPLTSVVNAKDPSSVVGSPFYQSDGYLSSLAAMHSLNPSISSHHFDVAGSDALRSSNLGFLSGFNVQRPIRPPHLYQMGNDEREVVSLYGQGFVNPSSSLPNTNTNTNINTITSGSGSGSGVSQHDWPRSFINNNNNNAINRASGASLWSTITTIGANSERTSTNGVGVGSSSSSLVANQWPNLPGYGPPP